MLGAMRSDTLPMQLNSINMCEQFSQNSNRSIYESVSKIGYEKTKNYIKLFASYDKDEDGITFGDRIAIPRSWVIKMTKI